MQQRLFFPFVWAFSKTTQTMGVPFRNPRFAIDYACIVLLSMICTWRWSTKNVLEPTVANRTMFICTFFAMGFIVWEIQFSIIRYTAALEMISAAPIIALLVSVNSHRTVAACPDELALIWATTQTVTAYPPGGHTFTNDELVRVDLPKMPDDSLVILLDGAPMAFVAAFAPPSVRFVGANNNLIRLQYVTDHRNLLARKVDDLISGFRGAMYGLQPTEDDGDEDGITLSRYHLRRNDCNPVKTNLAIGLKLCRLERKIE